MIETYYMVAFAVSLLFSAIYVYLWHKHFDINLTMVFTVVPVVCMGYVLFSHAHNAEEALIAIKITYIGGAYLPFFILFCIFNLCQIHVKKWLRVVMFIISSASYVLAISAGYNKLFYKSVSFEVRDGAPYLKKVYGPLHTLFFVYVFVFFAIGLIAIVYSLNKKYQVSRRVILSLIIPDIICVLAYVLGRQITDRFDFLPIGYVGAQAVFLVIAYTVNLYDLYDTVVDSLANEGEAGYITFDFKNRYLGSNDTLKKIVPEVANYRIDDMLSGNSEDSRKFQHFLNSFKEDNKNYRFVYSVAGEDGSDDDRIYNVDVNYLYDGRRKRGYFVTFTDDTKNRKYIQLLDTYNETLQQEVDEKTRNIVKMHDNLIMGLAMMVESRDNSTGGHIKRTSEGVRILIEEILKEGDVELDPEFCRNIIKAAPMHDLGKIAVPDAILQKPGRFTDEEYNEMKKHAPEGAHVIHEILQNTDDENFRIVAENVAHYHHERWDGSGYPSGLKGEEIPIEARIMAIADVYDALVSKRVYKEAMSFEQADAIILEGMGSQFDPSLRNIYVNARPKLEEYYGTQDR